MAGAKGLIMSLWPVDDEAGESFVRFFYSHLGKGPGEALRLAQLDMLTKTKYKEPRYWAGYSYSGDPLLRISTTGSSSNLTKSDGRGAKAANTSKANVQAPNGTLIIQPACFDIRTRSDDKDWTVLVNYRVKIAGAVKKVSSSAERVTYELLPPSSDLELTSANSIKHGPAAMSSFIQVASQSEFGVDLTIEKKAGESGLYIREYVRDDDQRYKPETMHTIVLKGASTLFPTFDTPVQLPPLQSYSEAAVYGKDQNGQSEKIDKISTCGEKPDFSLSPN
jgi:hypothetical protein